MSGALVSGAHENMPQRVVDDRGVVFLFFTSSQVVCVNATACLKTTNKIPHTPDTEETHVYNNTYFYGFYIFFFFHPPADAEK